MNIIFFFHFKTFKLAFMCLTFGLFDLGFSFIDNFQFIPSLFGRCALHNFSKYQSLLNHLRSCLGLWRYLHIHQFNCFYRVLVSYFKLLFRCCPNLPSQGHHMTPHSYTPVSIIFFGEQWRFVSGQSFLLIHCDFWMGSSIQWLSCCEGTCSNTNCWFIPQY